MTYDEALKVLNEIKIDYVPGAASWLEGLMDLWEDHDEAVWRVIAEWRTIQLDGNTPACDSRSEA